MTTTRRPTRSRPISVVAALSLAGVLVPAVAGAIEPATTEPMSPGVRTIATFGSGLGSGSAIGPDGALYVTDGNAGSVERVDLASGEVTTFAEGLPVQVLGIGGAMDIAFVDEVPYVLVTMVGGDIVGGDPIGDEVVGIYELHDDGSFSVVADLGVWAVENPPPTDYFITTGVHYAIEPFDDGLLVSDGHHNRVLSVALDGAIDEVITLDNVVPTGLATSGGDVLVGLAGPLPHLPADGQVVSWSQGDGEPALVASGASMIVDVEVEGEARFALSQGEWDQVQEGSPASPDTGRLMAIDADGTMTPVTGADNYELVLDRPTSLELVGSTGYVVTMPGEILAIEGLIM